MIKESERWRVGPYKRRRSDAELAVIVNVGSGLSSTPRARLADSLAAAVCARISCAHNHSISIFGLTLAIINSIMSHGH